MPKIVRTVTKNQPTDQWVLLSKDISSKLFTKDQALNIILPFIQFSNAQAGFIASSTSESFTDTTYTLIREYDTLEHLQAALTAMTDMTNPIVKAVDDLLAQKRQELGVQRPTISIQIV